MKSPKRWHDTRERNTFLFVFPSLHLCFYFTLWLLPCDCISLSLLPYILVPYSTTLSLSLFLAKWQLHSGCYFHSFTYILLSMFYTISLFLSMTVCLSTQPQPFPALSVVYFISFSKRACLNFFWIISNWNLSLFLSLCLILCPFISTHLRLSILRKEGKDSLFHLHFYLRLDSFWEYENIQ